jgi:hypothetical protein
MMPAFLRTFRLAALGGGENGVDETVHLQCLAPADARLASTLNGIEKIGKHRAMMVVREGHRIGAGTAGCFVFD